MYRIVDRCEDTQITLRHIARGVLCGLLVFVPVMLYGCAEIHIRIGKRPDIGALEKELSIGESTSAEVRAALGEPFGKGREMMIGEKPRTMWSYHYEEGGLKDTRGIFLFVFFDQDMYDGYMWFSSLPK